MTGPIVGGRMYLYFASNPTNDSEFFRLNGLDDGAALIACQMRINTSGIIRVRDQDSVDIFTFTTAVATGQWIRLDFLIKAQTATDVLDGEIYVSLFNNGNSDTATEVQSSTGEKMDWIFDEVWFAAGPDRFLNLDDVQINSFELPGPVAYQPPFPPRVRQRVRM